MNYTAKLRKTPPPAAAATVNDPMVLDEGGALAAGGLPAPLSEVAGRQLRVERHCGVGFELVLALDVPVLQMVEQPEEVDTFFRLSLPAGCRAGYRRAQACPSWLCCSARGSV